MLMEIVSRSQRPLGWKIAVGSPCIVSIMLCAGAFPQTPAYRAGLQPTAIGPRLVEATGVVLSRPYGLAFDATGNLYIADAGNNIIVEVSTTGVLSTVAGTGEQGFSGDSGPATSATLDTPEGVAVDATGNIYVADSHNQRVRKITSGTITTIAGTGAAGFSGDDGAAASAQLDLPTAVAVDAAGNVYVADTNNHRIRKIAGATITTVAGDGEQLYFNDGVPATQTALDSPNGISVDAMGNLYIGDTHNQRVREVSASTGLISTLAGNGTKGYSGDGGVATAAALARPTGISAATDGNIYFVDSDNNRIRNVSSAGTISTTAGSGGQGFLGDTGSATASMLDTPLGVATSPGGVVAVSDTDNGRIRALIGNNIDTVAGQGEPGVEALVLSGASPIVSGNGSATATLLNGTSAATGSVTFLDVSAGVSIIGAAPVLNNSATISLGGVAAGTHLLAASYPGDGVNPPLTSGVFVVVVTVAQTANNFSIAAAPASQSVAPGGAASYQLSLTPLSGSFPSQVTLTVAGLPSGASATFAPASIAAGVSGVVSSLLTIQTSKQSASLNHSSNPFAMPAALSLLSLPFIFSWRKGKNIRIFPSGGRIFGSLLLLVAATTLPGCGSGSGYFGQPPKSYVLTITATGAAVGTAPAVSKNTTVTLNVP
jgi:sugar lactone lactonase YvrE